MGFKITTLLAIGKLNTTASMYLLKYPDWREVEVRKDLLFHSAFRVQSSFVLQNQPHFSLSNLRRSISVLAKVAPAHFRGVQFADYARWLEQFRDGSRSGLSQVDFQLR
jgi:hypothetical protein